MNAQARIIVVIKLMGFLPGNSIGSDADRSCLVEMVMKEYITFPILLSNKKFLDVRFLYLVFFLLIYLILGLTFEI